MTGRTVRKVRLTLRLRVALAFGLATAVALAALGLFVYTTVAATLHDQSRQTVADRLGTLGRLPADDLPLAVRRLTGASFAQLLAEDGTVLESSPQVRDAAVSRDDLGAVASGAFVEHDVYLVSEREDEPVLVAGAEVPAGVLVVGTPTEGLDEVLAGLRVQLALGGLLALAIASGLGYVVARGALRPMERMRARAETISARSSGERLPVPDVDDEVGRLGRTLNDMLDRLDSGLQQQRTFVAEASHELRTPLALLRTELDLAVARSRTPQELADAHASMSEEVDRLAGLVDRLLVLAQADEGRLALDLAPVEVAVLLEDVAGRFAAFDPARVVVVERAPSGTVLADRRRLDQAVSNLVDNALRHGTGDVVLAAQVDADGATLTVADEGAVVLGEELFERFSRSEGHRSAGRGLGLALVRAIVAEHGGTVGSVATPGRTVVRIDLPASHAQ